MLPDYEMPRFDGIGANEYVVTTAHNVCDFISAVDTPAIWELNIWYHTLNCGMTTRISGETDFPCIYGERVGLGRAYVKIDGRLNYDAWCEGIRAGRAYVSDGKSHLIDFKANDLELGVNGSELKLTKPASVKVTVQAAAMLDTQPRSDIQTAPVDKKPFWDIERARIGASRQFPVELLVNGVSVQTQNITADGTARDLSFAVPVEKSCWLALRIRASSHTNPIFVIVNDQPIREKRSLEW